MTQPLFAWVISGDTYLIRDELRRRGFYWQPDHRVWAKPYVATDLEGNLELRKWAKTNELTLTEEKAEKFRLGSRAWYRFEGLKKWK